jgi:hypothetical protein
MIYIYIYICLQSDMSFLFPILNIGFITEYFTHEGKIPVDKD